MRFISCKLEDLKRMVLPIGYEGENDHTRVQVDAGEVFKEYPAAVPSLKVHGPGGTIYPAKVTRDGKNVIWDIKASDCAADGSGEAQFTFTLNNVIVKSCIAKIKVYRSIVGDGPAPDPVQDWIDDAEEVLDDLAAMDNIAKTAEAGDVGKALSPKTVENGVVTEWQYVEPGAGTEDYTDLENKPQIGGVTLSGDKSLHDLGIAAESAIPDVSGKANLSVVAPAFVQETANDAGSLVTYTDGVVYVLPEGHTAGTTWENTQKTATNIAEQQRLLLNKIQGKADAITKTKNDKMCVINDAEVNGSPVEIMAYYNPEQTGSGVPSSQNIRPFVGITNISLFHSKRNMFIEDSIVLGKWVSGSGQISNDGRGCITAVIPAKSDTAYTLFYNQYVPLSMAVVELDDNKAFIKRNFSTRNGTDLPPALTFTTTTNTKYIYCAIYTTEGDMTTSILASYKMQLEFGSEHTQYDERNKIMTEWSEPVYGCFVDFVNGGVFAEWGHIANYNGEALQGEWLSDRDVYSAGSIPTIGAEVVFKLTTPQKVANVSVNKIVFHEMNIVWSDKNDNVYIKYCIGIKKYIDQKTSYEKIQTFDKPLGNMSIRCAKEQSYVDGTAPKIEWFLLEEPGTGKFYYSKDLTSKEYMFTMPYPAYRYSFGILQNGDIIAVLDADAIQTETKNDNNRQNPFVFLSSEQWEICHEVDFGDSLKPCGWLSNCGYKLLADGTAIFCEYTRQTTYTANAWKINGDPTKKESWVVTKSFVVTSTDNNTGFKHCHMVTQDFYTGTCYLATGDDDEGAMLFYSADNGSTWTQLIPPGSESGSEKYCRMLSMCFTKDYVYWASDTTIPFYHWLFRIERDINGVVDYSTVTDLVQIPANNGAATYGIAYIPEYNGILLLDRTDVYAESMDVKMILLDSEEIVTVGTLYANPYQQNISYLGFRTRFSEWYPIGGVVRCGYGMNINHYNDDINHNKGFGNKGTTNKNGVETINNLEIRLYKNGENIGMIVNTHFV